MESLIKDLRDKLLKKENEFKTEEISKNRIIKKLENRLIILSKECYQINKKKNDVNYNLNYKKK